MARRYWLDVFSGAGWEKVLQMGATVTGFRKRKEDVARRVRPGDYFLCYVSGISRFIGVTEALSESYAGVKPLSTKEPLPVRVSTRLVHKLRPEHAVPILELKDRLFLFVGVRDIAGLSKKFKGCPMELEQADGKVILEAIEEAVRRPVFRKYDRKKYIGPSQALMDAK